MTVLCAICNRKSRGFGWFNPLFKVFDKRKEDNRVKEFVIFAVIGLLGVGIHTLVLKGVNHFQLIQL